MNRTQQEIVHRLKTAADRGFLGMSNSSLLDRLDFQHAREFLREGTTMEEWSSILQDVRPIRDEMIHYMPFAWEKANGCRGLSAGRSIVHYSNWLWLLGEEALAEEILTYEFYGKPQLIKICAFLNLDPAKWDDGVRTNDG